MSATPKSDKHVQGDYADTSTVSPLAGGHKPSFRGTKLARRARSFKEDFLEKISAMRSPGGGSSSAIGIRTHSPGGSPKSRHHHDNSVTPDSVHISDKTNPSRELESLVRQVQIALKHFRDVVTKNKLEMLPGNGTIVLDNVTSIHIALKQYLLDTTACNHSASLRSATHQVYQSLARLIKLCDDVLLFGDQSAALEKGNVVEVVTLVEDAVQNLVKLAQDKISNREPQYKPLPVPQRTSYGSNSISLDIPGQRNSLPDIPLTPRERQILEDTSSPVNLVRNSHSSESILCDSSPPPKPPLPDNICLSEPDSNSCGTPPPIPPKKRLPRTQQLIDECGSSDNSLLGCSLDIVSLRSRSPEDSSSLLSASAGSLDSVLNQSRDEEEIRGLMDQSVEDNIHNDLSELISQGENGPCHCNWADPTSDSHNPTIGLLQQSHELQPFSVDINLLSNTESGIGSSIRSSVQSFSTMSTSKRSSQQSSTSSQWSACNKHTSSQVNATFSQQNAFVKSESIIQNLSSVQKSESIIHNLSLRSELSEEKIIENLSQCVLKSETNIQNFSKSTFSSTTLSNMSQASTIIGLDNVDCGPINHSEENGVPPQLPQKMRPKKIRSERRPSQYDNVPPDALGEHVVTCAMHQSQQSPIPSNNQVDNNRTESPEKGPPPLPPKKKHIMAYMEMFGNCSHSSGNVDFLRHSMHTYNMMQADGYIQTESGYGGQVSHHSSMLSTTQSCSFSVSHGENLNNTNLAQSNNTSVGDISITMNLPSPPKSPISISIPNSSTPPALPPKKSKTKSISPIPPVSPRNLESVSPLPNDNYNSCAINLTTNSNHRNSTDVPKSNNLYTKPVLKHAESVPQRSPKKIIPCKKPISESVEIESEAESINLLEELDASNYLVKNEDGQELRGGHPIALMIHATKAKNFTYQDAFLTTYRTFMQPLELVQKLQYRHHRFSCHSDLQKQKAAKDAFSLLVRVVSDLTISDLNEQLLQTLMEFVYQLICNGDLAMAKVLRVKILEKYTAKQLHTTPPVFLSSLNVYTRNSTLLDFKSEQIAEQMTLLDADLFMKIEIPEVLIWAQEQNEERSPNLTQFTEHFNKMSYWARSRILEHDEAKDREKYVVKFIKIMKHLRKINNFNSYLALLSALDSAPIRRLEWQKQITEGLKEYCALIDSSSSFRAYRQALAETHPPCIPYIGLVLQDLTFVHIGNSDVLQDGSINFSKRWQQFNIVENMKRFKKGTYTFKKHDRIIAFFNNFEDYICEEAMWQISEKIKPRGGKKNTQ